MMGGGRYGAAIAATGGAVALLCGAVRFRAASAAGERGRDGGAGWAIGAAGRRGAIGGADCPRRTP